MEEGVERLLELDVQATCRKIVTTIYDKDAASMTSTIWLPKQDQHNDTSKHVSTSRGCLTGPSPR